MKNSASNQRRIQALQRQAKQLLPLVTHALAELGYQKAAHQRISQQNNEGALSYQGLTRAQHTRFGQVMIKWHLSLDPQPSPADLQPEIRVLKHLKPASTQHKETIAPPVLHSDGFVLPLAKPHHSLSFFTMPYYINGSLAPYLRQPITDHQKHIVIMQAAPLISALHQSGWIHGDIKPSNILIADDLSLLLTDFALAEPMANPDTHYFHKTNPIKSAGTPAYLAPECWQGQSCTAQRDIYAFGIMMYEILIGKRAFMINGHGCEPIKDWATQHCQQPVPVLPHKYRHYQAIINKALAKQLELRYQGMQEVWEDLQAL